jgi:hypothetical protein
MAFMKRFCPRDLKYKQSEFIE